MRIVVWVLVGIGALVVVGGVVWPLVQWLVGALLWLVPVALVVGGGIWLARRGSRTQVDGTTGTPQQLR
ncbi:hypothetical protein [Actinomycetospora lemnae]|uniref:DUF4175 domain-containing protein n=1 Tax=Actinomycetospora lemnae TaxID=3019891 RepID=A0ABT5SRQ6_9PSEU|nr:hypothetical protein [Actinomycetospora sp. DW7H6]MDD7964831.1 hypothetical protein [Actinomycetospora sp. DW7H6]